MQLCVRVERSFAPQQQAKNRRPESTGQNEQARISKPDRAKDVMEHVEIMPPDIAPYRKGNTGVDYFTTFDSGHSGPHVVLTAIVHGNELCGALALDLSLIHI